MKESALLRNSLIVTILLFIGTVTRAQEPYAALSDDNTVLTFYYDDQKEERNGLSVGPFSGSPSWYGQGERITSVVFDDSFANCTTLTSTAYWFHYLSKLSSITGISNLKTDKVTDMAYMFNWCYSLTSLDVTGFKTDNVTDMRKMFSGCSGLTSLDVTGFKTDNVTNMGEMFSSCSSLTSLDVTGFKTDNVTNMSDMFYGCSGLTSLDLSNFNTAKITDMSDLFSRCSGLTSLDVSGFNTQNVTSMSEMFSGCSNLTSLDLSGFKTNNVTNMGNMFYGCSGLTSLDVTEFKTDKVKIMAGMFSGCSSLTTIYAGNDWSTATVTSGGAMFTNCTNLKGGAGTTFDSNHTDYTYAHIDGGTSNPGYFTDKNAAPAGNAEPYAVLSDDNTVLTFYYDDQKTARNGMDVGPFGYPEYQSWYGQRESITSVIFDDSFADCITLTTTAYWFYGFQNLSSITGIGNLKTDNVTSMITMFYGCSSLTSLDVSGFRTDKVTNMGQMFKGCSSLTSLDVTGFKTDNVTNMNAMFSQCSSLTSLDVTGFKTDNVTNMGYMFYGCSGLTSLDVTGFKTDNVTDMREMFSGCSGLTSLDVTGFKTDNVTNMGNMFYGCSSLTSLDVTGFKTDNVTNMGSMFYGCSGLTSLDVTGFKTDNVTNMGQMFWNCRSLTSLDVRGFKTDNVTNMFSMFSSCSSLTSLDVTGFKTDNVVYMDFMFENCRSLTSLDVTGFKTDNVTSMGSMFYGCSGLTSLDVTRFKTDNVRNMDYMFDGCSGLTSLDLTGFKTDNVTSVRYMFYYCLSLKTIYVGDGWSTAKVQDSGDMFTGSLSLVGGAGTKYEADHIDHTYAHIDGGPDDPGYFTELSSYGITVAGVRVTNVNASAITGDNIEGTVTFDPDSRTLTMDGATINGCIYSYGDLTIDLKGENTITATDTCAIKNTEPTAMHNLTFKSTDGTGLLTINPWAYLLFEGFNEPSLEDGIEVILGNLSGGGTTVIKSIKYYDLWIGDIQINEKNCSDILGDANASQTGAGSFQYVSELNKLFITNNTDYLTIRTTNNKDLAVYLAPNSTNAVGNIVYEGNGNAKLTITTDGNYPGAISLASEADVISGFSSLTLEQNLVIMEPEDIAYDGSNKRLAATSATIGVPLTPITEDRIIIPDGGELQPEFGSDDINKVVDDILYTLGNVNNSNGDGYDDGGFIVINSVTTDQQAVRVTQEFTPGTNEYLEGFKGLTFMVPAGSGKIIFDMQTLDGYAMKVMVGDAAPVTVKKAEKGIVEIPYNVAEPTYVYAYNAGKIGNTSSARGIQKGKMTTVHIKVYGSSVKTNKVKQSNSAAQASGGEYRGDTSALEGQEMETDEEIEAGKGDINGDEAVNVADIIGLANAIMGRHSATFDKRAADLNNDGIINAEDIIIITNKILK